MPPKSKPKEKKPTRAQVAAQAVAAGMTAPLPTKAVVAGGMFGPNPAMLAKPLKKGEVITVADRRSEIMQHVQAINAQFRGKAVLREGSDIVNVFVLRRPTGIVNLDLKIGGGLPAGGLTQIIGRYSAGKSYLANRVMAVAQETYGHDFAAAVNMTEQRYDKSFAKGKCGLRVAYSEDEIEVFARINREYGKPDFTPEYLAWLRDGVGTFVEGVAGTAEEILEVACQQIEQNLYHVILIDSFGALLTAAEAEHEEGLAGKHRGGAAMVVTQFMHRLHAALNLPDKYGRPNTTTVIGINQYRDNVNAGQYGNPMKVAGGNSLAHGKLLDIHVEQGAKIRAKVGSVDNVIIGKEINWEILKQKAGGHDGHKGSYSFYFGEHGHGFGIDTYTDLLVAGLQMSVIDQAGAWFSYQGERLGQGKDNVAITLYQNPDLLQRIRKDIFKTAGLDFIIDERQ